jgi:hypothetical protein
VSPKLSDLELAILRKLLNGEAVAVPSFQRVRLELAGVFRETAQGIVLTAHGRDLARQKAVDPLADDESVDPFVGNESTGERARRDGRGRRLPFQRRSIF